MSVAPAAAPPDSADTAQEGVAHQLSLGGSGRGLRLDRTPEPFLKWAGGKKQLLHQFAALLPATFERYYEPFIGSGAVFLHVQPERAVLNDSNPNLIAAYRHVQQCIDDLLSRLHALRKWYHSLSPERQESAYYDMRDRYNGLAAGAIEKSALLIVLNKTGYNGLYRENARGMLNVPFGRYNNPGMFCEQNMRAVSQALQGVDLLNTCFAEAVCTARRGDFVYFDPPYMPRSKTSSFTSYTRGTFGKERQAQVAAVARALWAGGVQVMISNSDTEFIRELYHDFYQYEVRARRAINSKATARGRLNELVMTSYPVQRPFV